MSDDPAELLPQVGGRTGADCWVLVRQFRRLDLAEEGLSAAFEQAASRWPVDRSAAADLFEQAVQTCSNEAERRRFIARRRQVGVAD